MGRPKPRYCAVNGCNPPKYHPFSFYTFPKDSELCRKWVKLCCRNDFNFRSSRICGKHFSSSQRNRNFKQELLPGYRLPRGFRQLKDDAIPDQHLPYQIVADNDIEKELDLAVGEPIFGQDNATTNASISRDTSSPTQVVVATEEECQLSSPFSQIGMSDSQKCQVWSSEATSALIALVEQEQERLQNPTSTKKGTWQRIASQLSQYVPGVTDDQAEGKWQNMLLSVWRFEEHERKPQGNPVQEPPYLQEVLRIVGKDDPREPDAAVGGSSCSSEEEAELVPLPLDCEGSSPKRLKLSVETTSFSDRQPPPSPHSAPPLHPNLPLLRGHSLFSVEEEAEPLEEPSTAQSGESPKGLFWNSNATAALVALVEQDYERLLDPISVRKGVWQRIADNLLDYMPKLTPQQVEKKWKNMLRISKTFEASKTLTSSGKPMKKPSYLEDVLKLVSENSGLRPAALRCSYKSTGEAKKQRVTPRADGGGKPKLVPIAPKMAPVLRPLAPHPRLPTALLRPPSATQTSTSLLSTAAQQLGAATQQTSAILFANMRQPLDASSVGVKSEQSKPPPPSAGQQQHKPVIELVLCNQVSIKEEPDGIEQQDVSSSSLNPQQSDSHGVGVSERPTSAPLLPVGAATEEDEAEEDPEPPLKRGRSGKRVRPRRHLDMLSDHFSELNETYKSLVEVEREKLEVMRGNAKILRRLLELAEARSSRD